MRFPRLILNPDVESKNASPVSPQTHFMATRNGNRMTSLAQDAPNVHEKTLLKPRLTLLPEEPFPAYFFFRCGA